MPAWFSLLASEVGKIFTLVCHQEWTRRTRFITSLTSITVPCLLQHKAHHFRVEEHKVLNQFQGTDARKANELRKFKMENSSLSAMLRSVENSLEHLPQLAIALCYFSLAPGSSAKIDKKTTLSILGDNLTFITISAFISAFSLVVGQGWRVSTKLRYLIKFKLKHLRFYLFLRFRHSNVQSQVSMTDNFKNGAHGLIGKAILGVYYFVGSAGRLLPLLSLYQSTIRLYLIIPDSATKRSIVLITSTVVPILMHFLGSIILQTYFARNFPIGGKIRRRFLQALWSFICPPLFLDWELIYKNCNQCNVKISIEESWKRSKIIFALNNVMMFIENLLFCIPLFIYKYEVDTNSKFAEDKWSPLVRKVTLFSNLNITSAFLTPFMMGGLAYFYFIVKGHPWTRILNDALREKEDIISNSNHNFSMTENKDNSSQHDFRPRSLNISVTGSFGVNLQHKYQTI